MRREGKLEELIKIEKQTAMTLENASPELLAKIEDLVASEEGASIVETGHPRTTLERLFIQIAERRSKEKASAEKKEEAS